MVYDRLHPRVPAFQMASTDVTEGERMAPRHGSALFGIPGGRDVSPQLSWSGFPAGVKSFVVTCFDPDAPTPSGFWHWGLVDIPAGVTGLPSAAGASDAELPGGAFHVASEVGLPRFVGSAPPEGTGRHRYVFAVHALDVVSVRDLGVSETSTIAVLHFLMRGHTLGRAVMTAWASADE